MEYICISIRKTVVYIWTMDFYKTVDTILIENIISEAGGDTQFKVS